MMDDDISNLIRREVQRALMGVHPTVGVVKSYDKTTHAVKVEHQPDGTQSGWAPIMCKAAGKALSVAHGPSPGDQAIVAYLNGDRESPVVIGFIHSDQDPPPQVESGETVFSHTQGAGTGSPKQTVLKIDKNGAVALTTQKDNATITVSTTGASAGVSTATQGDNSGVSTTTSGNTANVTTSAAHGSVTTTADQGVAINSGSGVVDINS